MTLNSGGKYHRSYFTENNRNTIIQCRAYRDYSEDRTRTNKNKKQNKYYSTDILLLNIAVNI